MEIFEHPTTELDVHTRSVTQSEPERARIMNRSNADQVPGLVTAGAFEHVLRELHDAQCRGILSASNYVDSKAVAVTRWLHDADQGIDRRKLPPDPAEDRTAGLGEHPHTVDLNQEQIPVVGPEPISYLPVEKVSMAQVPTPDSFQPRRTIRGRYVIEELIGQGGFANVYRAIDLRRDAMNDHSRHVAVKVLRPEFRDRPGTTPRLKREFRQTQLLQHPAIVRTFDLDAHDRVWFIVMELLQGETLATRLRRMTGIPMPLPETHALLAACADALSFAHNQHIVHGDFKPTNIFMLHDGSVRIIDFGSSPEMTADRSGVKPDPIKLVATPAYASPQVLHCASAVPRDDLFSFACVAFEILAGYHPFSLLSSVETQTSNDAARESATLPPALMAMLKQGLAGCREDRPASVHEFFQSLTTLMAADPEWQHRAAAVSADVVLTMSPVMPAPDVLLAPFPTADPETRPTLVSQVLAAPAASTTTLVPSVAEAASQPAIRAARRRSHDAPPSPITRKVSVVSSLGRIPLYGCAVLFVLAYLGFLAFHSPPMQLNATAAARSIARQTQVAAQTPQQGTTHRPVDATIANIQPASKLKPSASIGAIRLAPAVSFSTPSMTVTPRAGLAAIIVKRINGHSGRLRVKWQLQAGSAAIGEDFSGPISGFAEFADNQQVRTLFVPLLNNPNHNDDRSFIVELSNVSNGAVISPVRSVKVTILGVS